MPGAVATCRRRPEHARKNARGTRARDASRQTYRRGFTGFRRLVSIPQLACAHGTVFHPRCGGTRFGATRADSLSRQVPLGATGGSPVIAIRACSSTFGRKL